MNITTQKEAITSKQLMFAIACFVFGSTLLSSFVIGVTKQDTWIVVITGFILGVIVMLINIILLSKFPGKTIIEINDIIFGKIIGKIISALYIFYILTAVYLNSRDVGNFVVTFIMPETPLYAVLIIFFSACALAAYKGITTIVRLGFLLILLYILSLGTGTLMLFNNMNFANFAPAFTLPIKDYIQGTHIIGLIPFGEPLIFMMIYPNVDNQSEIKKSVFKGMLIAAIAMLVLIVRDWAVLGSVATMFTSPPYQAVSIIDFGDAFSRAEALFSVSFVVLLFFKISVIYYALMLAIAQIFSLKAYKPFVVVVGIISICLSISAYTAGAENQYFGSNIGATYVTFYAVILPVITLIIAKVKSLGRKRECT